MNSRVFGLMAALFSAIFLLNILFHNIQNAASQIAEVGVIISEVAWAGTRYSATDEWIELYNAGDSAVMLTGWSLVDSSGDVVVDLQGEIDPGGFFLLERSNDEPVADVAADQIYIGGLNNSGETLTLLDEAGVVVDTANGGGGTWPAGAGSPDYVSMERVDAFAADDDGGWANNNGIRLNGVDWDGNPIRGTPRAANSGWITSTEMLPDLVLGMQGPRSVVAGTGFSLTLEIENTGLATATHVVMTVTLPSDVRYVQDDWPVAPDEAIAGQIVWSLASFEVGEKVTIAVTLETVAALSGEIGIAVAIATIEEELFTNNNYGEHLLAVIPEPGAVLIGALLYDGYELNDADEAIQLVNRSTYPVVVGGWSIGNGRREATLPADLTIGPQQSIWLARDGAAFERQFGFMADAVLSSWPGFTNSGDALIVRGQHGTEIDTLVYKAGALSGETWHGPTVAPYRVSGLFAEEGQLLFRQRDERSGLPIEDTDTASDWAQSLDDPLMGRRVMYPGWSLDAFFQPVLVTATRPITIGIAPDNAYALLMQEIERAKHTIKIAAMTMEHVAIGEALASAAARGVEVTILLEGSPVGGIDNQERYVCQRIETGGGACWFMIRDDGMRIHDRYRYLHAKYVIIDDVRALVSSENLSPSSLPDDEKEDGTFGRRGLIFMTSEPEVVKRLLDIFHDDLDAEAHVDLVRWQETDDVYGPPPEGYVPITVTGGTSYTIRFPNTQSFGDVTQVGVYHAPENLLRRRDGLFAILGRAGRGDLILVQQLTERWHWGASNSNAEQDPNPRLQAYIEAARRGASVRLLLDGHFDTASDPLSNAATCAYLQQVANDEQLRLHCAVGNPTGQGIHNKMILMRVQGRGWVHAGSWNGTEQAAKGNREVALLVQSDAAFAYLSSLFDVDWPHETWLPLVSLNFRGAAVHPLISEILYDPAGLDDGEFIELSNPTSDAVDLSGWTIADAVFPDDFEDARRFPEGTVLAPRGALVVALSGVRFIEVFGFAPDFEILNSRDDIPDMIDDIRWGDAAAILQLGNTGDELLLRAPDGVVVDVVTYGAGHYPGVTACPLVDGSGSVYERIPFWRDTDDCTNDFRIWPFPSPGTLP